MSMSEVSQGAHLERSSGAVAFSCHICGGSETDRICPSREVEAHIEFLRRFHRRRLRHPTESALQDRVNFTQAYVTDIVACRNCGLLCRSPHPSADAITEAYSEDRYGREHLDSEFRLQRHWAEYKVRTLMSRLPGFAFRVPLVVEVGSFVGGFLSAGRERGWRMLGVDPGREVASFCRDRGLNVFCGTLIETPIEPGTVDAVAIWNTFDQLPNPDSTLAAARQMLGEQGILVIRVPNGASFRHLLAWQKRAREPLKSWVRGTLAWNNLLGFPYVYGYTVRTMDQLLARHGFARLDVCPDTLMTLADEASTTWAHWEERFLKWTCLIAARVKQAASDYHLAPWLDIYYRTVQSVPDTTVSVARESRAIGIAGQQAWAPIQRGRNR